MSFEYLLTTLIVVLIPGTGVIYTISTGLMQGGRASIWAALGCTLGIIPALLASVLGLAAIQGSPLYIYAPEQAGEYEYRYKKKDTGKILARAALVVQ